MHNSKGIERRLNFEWEGERMEQGEETAYEVIIISANGKIDKRINSRMQRTNQVYYQIKNSKEE
jgi:hypothetical protein